MGEPHPTLKRDEIPFAVALGPSASSCSSSYSYKNNLRELIHIAINDCHPKNMEQFKKLLASWGVDIFIKNNRVYATDLDIKEAGNPRCTFNLTRLDGRFAVKQLEAAFEKNVLEAEQALPYEKRCEIYIQRLKKAYSAWVEQAKASKGVAYNSFPKSSSHRSAMRICSKIRRFATGFLRVAATQGRFATAMPAPFPMPATTAFAPPARRTAVATRLTIGPIALSIVAITRAATRPASLFANSSSEERWNYWR